MVGRENLTVLLITLLVLLWACEPSRAYREGVLSEHYRMMSNAELQRYQARLGDEIARVELGGPVPEGADRTVYLEVLRDRRKDVESQIRGNISRQRYEQYRRKMDLMYGY
ncbi:MAG: hypothetical protein NTV99_08435 [Deltaproteobacteria bacterium]|nr:hypothetical protein [Deltaproteobacteria bacterium]